MKKPAVHEITVPIFDVSVRVYYGVDGAEARDKIEGWINRNTRNAYASSQAYVQGADGKVALWISPGGMGDDGLIVHECVHVVWSIFKHVGIDNLDQEVFAYLLEWLYTEIKKRVG